MDGGEKSSHPESQPYLRAWSPLAGVERPGAEPGEEIPQTQREAEIGEDLDLEPDEVVPPSPSTDSSTQHIRRGADNPNYANGDELAADKAGVATVKEVISHTQPPQPARSKQAS